MATRPFLGAEFGLFFKGPGTTLAGSLGLGSGRRGCGCVWGWALCGICSFWAVALGSGLVGSERGMTFWVLG